MHTTTERMTSIVPAEVKADAQERRDVNWSAVVSKAIGEKLAALELVGRIAQRSDLAEEDVTVLADLIDVAMAKRFGVDG